MQKNGKTVLVIEDYKFTQDLISSLLEGYGYIVIGRSGNGKKALELYKELSPDVVTMDMNLPGMNGLQAIKSIIDFDPEARILAITGFVEVEEKAKELGALGFLAKPFQPIQLFEQIEKVLQFSFESKVSVNEGYFHDTPLVQEQEDEKDVLVPIEEEDSTPSIDSHFNPFFTPSGEDEKKETYIDETKTKEDTLAQDNAAKDNDSDQAYSFYEEETSEKEYDECSEPSEPPTDDSLLDEISIFSKEDTGNNVEDESLENENYTPSQEIKKIIEDTSSQDEPEAVDEDFYPTPSPTHKHKRQPPKAVVVISDEDEVDELLVDTLFYPEHEISEDYTPSRESDPSFDIFNKPRAEKEEVWQPQEYEEKPLEDVDSTQTLPEDREIEEEEDVEEDDDELIFILNEPSDIPSEIPESITAPIFADGKVEIAPPRFAQEKEMHGERVEGAEGGTEELSNTEKPKKFSFKNLFSFKKKEKSGKKRKEKKSKSKK